MDTTTMVSRISLYDMLAIFLPGAMVLSAIILLLGNNLNFYSNCVNSVIVWVVFFIVSYLLGLLNNVVTSSAVSLVGFRNNVNMIARAFNTVYENLSSVERLSAFRNDMRLYERGGNCCLKALLAMLVIILTAILINGISKNDVGETRFLVVIPFLIYSILLLSSAFKCGRYYANNNERKILDNYYIAYYAASENKKHEDISIIESQVAFILNMIFPLLLFILIPSNRLSFLDTGICDYSTMVPAIKALVFVGIILISVCAYMRQMTIYRRVWEDYEFLNKP